jgi:chorismate mutase-like protein
MTTQRSLEDLRREIDALDDRIHDALVARADLAASIRAAKGAGAPALRPGREAAVVRRLVSRHRGPLPAAVIVQIWREIMTALVRMQGGFAIAVAQTAGGGSGLDLARAHFGSLTNLRPAENATRALNALLQSRVQLAVLPLPEDSPDEPWWRSLGVEAGTALNIVGRLPIAKTGASATALLVGAQPYDASGDDHGYLVLRAAAALSHAKLRQALEAAGIRPLGFPATYDGNGAWTQLVELAEHVPSGDARLGRVANDLGAGAVIHAIGGYAVPLELVRG